MPIPPVVRGGLTSCALSGASSIHLRHMGATVLEEELSRVAVRETMPLPHAAVYAGTTPKRLRKTTT